MGDSLPDTAFPETPADGEQLDNDYDLLKQVLMNERTSPEILSYETELVVRLENQISAQEELIEQIETDMELELPKVIFVHEVQRVKYLLKSYYRTRLDKISYKFNVAYILDRDEEIAKLSAKERTFAEAFFVAVAAHMRVTLLDKLPECFASLVKESGASSGKDLIPEPNLDEHVFCRVLRDCGNVTIDHEGNTVSLEAGDLVVLRYRPVAQLMADGAVYLV